jgi:hypothetical protein
MKKYQIIVLVTLLIFSVIQFSSCDFFKKKDDLKDVQINPKFEMTPPIAEDVFVQKIEGDDKNILVVAKFSKEQLNEKFLAIDNDGEKLVLRDDGKGDDKKAGDGLFTAKVKADVSAFENDAIRNNKVTEGKKQFTFRGRSIISDTFRAKFDIEKLAKRDIVSIRDLLAIAPTNLKDHSLMITDLNVVENPARTWNVCNKTGNVDGPWTFKTLMKNLASTSPGIIATDVQLSDFVENWLTNWLNNLQINSEAVPSRAAMNSIITNWKNVSQTLPIPRVPVGKLDMRAAPFKLTAIVNRLDLRGNSGYGFSNAGEGRFVFCLIENCVEKQFNIIFEYGIPKTSCSAIKAFAAEWYDLSNFNFTDPQYLTKLEAITNQFTVCGTSPSKPNQSSLNQLRTNEIRLSSPWELREFNIDNTTHKLKPVTVKQEPAVKYNTKIGDLDVERLVIYINNNEASILLNKFTIPDNITDVFGSGSFLGGHAITQFPPTGGVGIIIPPKPHHWDGEASQQGFFINNDDARQIFSLNTCSGCHGGETQTFFTMIDPVPFGTEAGLSGFLTGHANSPDGSAIDLDGSLNDIMFVPDPARRFSTITLRQFNDLQRRSDDLDAFVNAPCRSIRNIRNILMRDPIRFSH